MDSGKLRHRITIRRGSKTKTTRGEVDRAWSTLAENLPANVVSLNGRESVVGHVLQGISYFEITIRFREDIKPSDQILWVNGGGRELNVHSAEDRLGTRHWTVIQASTMAPQGA